MLGRWISHYIAELIAAVDDAGGDDVHAARTRAADEILKLWIHRSSLPQPYPLESFDRIFAAIDRMERQPSSSWLTRYFGDAAPDKHDLEVTPLLAATTRLDDDVSQVVTLLIAEAAAVASETEAAWLPIATGISEEASARAIRRLLSAARRRAMQADLEGTEVEPERPAASDVDKEAAEDAEARARHAVLLEAVERATDTLTQIKAALTPAIEPVEEPEAADL